MGNINFYLKKKEESTGRSLIYLQYLYNGLKLTWSFGQTIDPKNWNKAKQRVKSNRETTADGKHSLNDMLDTIEDVLNRAYHSELKQGIPAPDTLKQHLNKWLYQGANEEKKPTLYKLIDRFIANEIQYDGKDKQANTIRKYRTVYNHLKEFEKKYKYKVDYDTITLSFFYKYVAFLKTIPIKDREGNIIRIGHAQNSIAKDISVLKVFMNEGVDLGETNNMQFKLKKFNVKEEDTDAVYLTEKEIIKLFNHDFSENKRMDQVRDLFVFGCFTGLRFSDYSAVKPSSIVKVDGELFIKTVTKKTGEQVIIPCNPIILKIFEKYADSPNKLPKAISNQKFNDYIKDACKAAGMTEKGRLITDADKELWECVSSHTARRSFATNLYLDGFPTLDIMKITGHKTERAFMKYIRTSKLDAAKRLSAHNKKSWSEKLLRVA